ncbi:DUF2953 domain-containing protein [Methanosarcina sp. WWM596]|uniref:DUF2953 domain-containing protein n=1 Tax=Methanosarcina sp. WWM596 TaxID=1434103 RepID=UPI000615BE2A|nr:DUF2953 domain-containing protein [Methanosarcina sp. WWM596]AKB17119.1 hypothetical protein MSWHS_0256 [Methanosarcina sp. WWM596]
MLAIYLFLLVFLLVLFILFTAIVLTFKFKVLSVEEKKELGGIFTVKWLLFSYTFSIKEPEEEKSIPEKPEPEEAESRKEDLLKSELKMQMEKDREPGEKKPEEETLIFEGKEKRGIFARLRRKKETGQEVEVEAKKGMSTREKLHWGLEAYKALRKPLLRLFSDTLSAIKIKNLKADLTFGLSDPADTGMLCGLIHALLGTVYNRCRNCSFSVCPVFMETLLDFRGNAEIRIKIYSLIFPFLKFIFNGKTLSFTYSIVKEKLRGSSKVNS